MCATVLGASLSIWLVTATAASCGENSSERASIDRIIGEASARFGLPPRWIQAVISAESGGDASAVSPKGAMGLMQLMPATWRDLSVRHGLGSDPFDRRANVLAGAAYMRHLLERFGRAGFLAAYNAGPGRYAEARSGRRQLPLETVRYVARIEQSIAAGSASREPITPGVALDWRTSELFVSAPKDGQAMSQALFPGAVGSETS